MPDLAGFISEWVEANVRDAKPKTNQARDRRQSAGWTVLRLWEHELAEKREPRLMAKLRKALGSL
jgi:hypothetical protein